MVFAFPAAVGYEEGGVVFCDNLKQDRDSIDSILRNTEITKNNLISTTPTDERDDSYYSQLSIWDAEIVDYKECKKQIETEEAARGVGDTLGVTEEDVRNIVGDETIEQIYNEQCLIATASFGSPLADEVQMLREIRDNQLRNTQAGTSFMTGFNAFYYTFSPTIAEWENQNPLFKDVVRATITPLIASLSILNYLPMDSEDKVLGYGIGLILLNIGMYFVAPAIVLVKIGNKLRK